VQDDAGMWNCQVKSLLLQSTAQMAELVDALDSKSGFGNGVQVRFLFWAQKNRWLQRFFYAG
jgi:hypothetical protein